MAEDLQIYEDTIRRLLENKGILEPDIADYDSSRMRSYYFKKQQYQQKFEFLQDEIRNGRIKIGECNG